MRIHCVGLIDWVAFYFLLEGVLIRLFDEGLELVLLVESFSDVALVLGAWRLEVLESLVGESFLGLDLRVEINLEK